MYVFSRPAVTGAMATLFRDVQLATMNSKWLLSRYFYVWLYLIFLFYFFLYCWQNLSSYLFLSQVVFYALRYFSAFYYPSPFSACFRFSFFLFNVFRSCMWTINIQILNANINITPLLLLLMEWLVYTSPHKSLLHSLIQSLKHHTHKPRATNTELKS